MPPVTARHLAFVLIILLLPSPAQAWFGWLDRLSGPGGFHSRQVELRLFCFGPDSPVPGLLRDLSETRVTTARFAADQNSERYEAARAAWLKFLSDYTVAVDSSAMFPRDAKTVIEDLYALIAKVDEQRRSRGLERGKEWVAAVEQLQTQLERTARAGIDAARMTTNNVGAVGVLWSFCSEKKERRLSVEFAASFYATFNDDPKWAGGQRIAFTTFMPGLSWHAISNPWYDVVDLGVSGGVYVFTSGAFPSFSGVVLQPYRLDFHAPSAWSTYLSSPRNWRKLPLGLATLVSFRHGYLLFPQGFKPDVFAAEGQRTPRLEAELVRTRVWFLNLEPLAKMMMN